MKTLNEASYFTVSCAIERGSQPLFFQWHKNGHSINKQSNQIQINSLGNKQSILTIEKVTSNDSGNYTCEVKNAFGEDTFTSQLIVRGTNKCIYNCVY